MEYAVTAIAGAVGLTTVKILMNSVPPEYSSAIGAIPIGLLSTLFLRSRDERLAFLNEYVKFLAILLVCASVYNALLRGTSLESGRCLLLTLGLWCVCMATFLWWRKHDKKSKK